MFEFVKFLSIYEIKDRTTRKKNVKIRTPTNSSFKEVSGNSSQRSSNHNTVRRSLSTFIVFLPKPEEKITVIYTILSLLLSILLLTCTVSVFYVFNLKFVVLEE